MHFVTVFALFLAATAHADRANPARLMETVTTLAQPAWEGRLAGSPGGEKAREWLIQRYTEIGIRPLGERGTYEQPIRRFYRKRPIGTNVLGYLGQLNSASACVMIGAHYDGLGVEHGVLHPGADDNASGVASMLELARMIQPFERVLKNCVIFAAWDYEEGDVETFGGLKGSMHFVRHPTVPLEKIRLSLTMDLVGGHFFKGAENTMFVFGAERSSALRAALDETHPGQLELLPFSTQVLEPLGKLIPRSDYGPLRNQEIPYLFLTTGTPGYYHRLNDTPDRIDPKKLAAVTDYTLRLIWPYLRGEREWPLWGEAEVDRRYDDLRQAIAMIDRLLTFSWENELSAMNVAQLKSDRASLARYLEASFKELPECRLQISFVHLLLALGTGDVDRAEASVLDAFCPNHGS